MDCGTNTRPLSLLWIAIGMSRGGDAILGEWPGGVNRCKPCEYVVTPDV